MESIIGYSAYNVNKEAYECKENGCLIADSIESLKDFITGAGFPLEDFRIVLVKMSDILVDYAASCGQYSMEQEALKRFEKGACSAGIHYSLGDCCEGLVNAEIVLPRMARGMEKRDIKVGLAPKIHKNEPVTLVTFSSQKNRFLLVKRYCTNPSCTANDISLTFVEIDEKLKPVANPLHFTIWLDLDTGKEIKPPERPESVSLLVEEFLNDLTEEMTATLFSEVRSMKKDEERLAKCQINPQNVRKGALVSYTHIVSDGGSITQHGKEVSFRFLDKGREYLVEDLYCPDPDCPCKKVHLHFFELTRELSEPARIIECFMSEMTFKGRMKIFDLFTYNSEDAEDLMEAWKVRHPDVLGVLKERYEKIKGIGKRSLQVKGIPKIPGSNPHPGIKAGKIGRNEPCPCGSGKKYKKCCGA